MIDTILGLADHNHCEKALELFQEMDMSKNEYTYSILFKICARIADSNSLNYGIIQFNKMPNKFHENSIVLTSALQMFLRSKNISAAEQIFEKIKEKNLIVFSIMMNGKFNFIGQSIIVKRSFCYRFCS